MTDHEHYPEKIINTFPQNTQETIKYIWSTLSAQDQKHILDVINNIPSKSNLLKLFIDLSVVQFKRTFGKKHKVAIVGPANVGKSTLYNQFIRDNDDIAEVSPIPGTTRNLQLANAGIFSVIDTPGADSVGAVGESEKNIALKAASESDLLIIVFDASQGIRLNEISLFKDLVNLNLPFIVVLNKIDLIRRHINEAVDKAAENLHISPEQIIPITAKNAENLDKVILSVALSEPEIIAAMGQALPQYRWQLAWRSIISAASISGVIAITPIPIIDFAPMIINQSIMVLGIARIYHYEISIKRAKEIAATFGLGFLGRTVFYEISKFGGIPGWLLSVAIAVSTTVAMGYGAVIWFEKGERVSSDTLEKITREITSTILNVLKNIKSSNKEDKKEIKQIIIDSLESISNIGQKSIIQHRD